MDYSNLPPLARLVITTHEACWADYALPVISQYRDVREVDLTSSTDPKYCAVDCVRRRWVAFDGASVTFTVARASSATAATNLLKEELERIQQLYSDPTKFLGFGLDDPYTGDGDSAWAGKPYPGQTGYYSATHSSIFIEEEWYIVPHGFDLEFDFAMTKELARLQFQKIDGALGTPYPSLTQQARCTP